jgi:L-2-hydroxyglutarate oxidase LhgO
MERVEITIIGAGVIGLAIASEIGKEGVFVVEKNASFGQETSSRNSEVIHSGIYYPKNSLRARTCVEGKHMLYEICKKNSIPYRRIGKFVVATNGEEAKELERLLRQGKENGVEDLEILSKREIEKIEPYVRALAALYSPSDGIVDTHSLMFYFQSKAKEKGAEILYNTEVIGIEKTTSGYKLTVKDADGEYFSFQSNIVINSAGLHSDEVAEKVGIDVVGCGYQLKYCKGSYFQVHDPPPINHLVYPVPGKVSLGIHVVIDIGGRIRLGPDAEYIPRLLDYSVNPKKRAAFFNAVKSFLPFLKEEALTPDMAGIRPKLQGEEEEVKDFVIKHEEEIGYPGFINLIGIDSPGLTAAPSIAKLVRELIFGQ